MMNGGGSLMGIIQYENQIFYGQEKKGNTIAAKQQKGRTSLNAEGKYHRPWYDISFEEMEILEDD